VEDSPEVCLPSERVWRVSQRRTMKHFGIALLLVIALLTFLAVMLVHYPQKVDAFLNSDEPVETGHVVASR
jgi:hypothetical protein